MSLRDGARRWIARIGLIALATCGAAACTGGITPFLTSKVDLDDTTSVRDASFAVRFDQLVAAAEAHGWTVALVQPSRARFGLYARYADEYVEEYGPYRIAVSCGAGYECEITPIGPRVECASPAPAAGWGEQRWYLPERFAEELLDLTVVLDRAGRRSVAEAGSP